MIADLHIHTTASDGQLSPADIVKEAFQAGLSCIAITDHDTVNGVIELKEKPDLIPKGLTVIPGIEFSTDLPENEVHILGYHIDIFNSKLHEQLHVLVNDRHNRIEKMVAKLNSLGYQLEFDRVIELAGQASSIGRPHLAKALIEKGYFNSITEVFINLLDKNKPAYVPHYKLAPKCVIDLIKSSRGIPVLAHPGLVGNDEIVLKIINMGIMGLEVYHPRHDEKQIAKYLKMAKEYNLIITGGSDYHAIPTRYPEKLGIFSVPAELISSLINL